MVFVLLSSDTENELLPFMKFYEKQGFPGLPFWQFLPPKPCSGPSKARGKGPEQCIYDQSKIVFIYLWIHILMYFWFKRQELSIF